LTKARLIYLVLLASLFACILASTKPGLGMSDGGGF
jgi:hypothetical protein